MDKEDVLPIRNGILLSHKKRMKYCHMWQHGWTKRLSYSCEVSQKEKDKYWYLCYISDSTYMQNVTHGTNEPIIKQKEASDIEN